MIDHNQVALFLEENPALKDYWPCIVTESFPSDMTPLLSLNKSLMVYIHHVTKESKLKLAYTKGDKW